MGTWSHIIKGNDFTVDIISEYYDLFDSEVLPTDIRTKLEEEYCPIDDEEYSNFWTAIALCQWECGQLEDYVFDKVKQSITEGYGLHFLLEEDNAFYSKRKKELEKFIEKIQSGRTTIRKPKKNKSTVIPNGTVYGFLLPANLGYGYAKYVNFLDEFETAAISRVFQVFDIRTEKLETDVSFLKNIEYLFGPRILYKMPNTSGQGAWKIIGEFITKKDLEHPVFVDKRAKGWIPVDYSMKKDKDYGFLPLKTVEHLEPPTLSTKDMIATRAAMTFLKNSGDSKLIGDTFDLKKDWIKTLFEETMNKPKYSDIPDRFKKRPYKQNLIERLKSTLHNKRS